jgi:integral membrane protein (TIGR01906 family)
MVLNRCPEKGERRMILRKKWQIIVSWLVTILLPVALALLGVRLVLMPWFVELEYRTPGFPDDSYGFTRQERIQYARIALDYLINDTDISFLADLRFPGGEQAPDYSCQFMDDCTHLYNDRELEHMVDVKNAIHWVQLVLYTSLALILVMGIWAWYGKWWQEFCQGMRRGGLLTLILIGVILLFVLVGFGVFFIFFHEIFFAAGTWTFYYSDTLIRLFPERFWRDTFLVVGVLAAGLGLLIERIFRK